MYEAFLRVFDENANNNITTFNTTEDFLSYYSGHAFCNGLYRLISSSEKNSWVKRINKLYPESAGGISPFGVDWLGRCFAICTDKNYTHFNQVVLFDICAVDAYVIPLNISDFHNIELCEHSEEALEKSLFEEWKKKTGKIITNTECCGLRIPLFLGGELAFENMEVSDIDVYWEIITQVVQSTGSK